MIEFLLLLLAHVLADFYWQPTAWVVDKREKSFRSKYLYAHVGVVIITSYILLGHFENPVPAIAIGLVHGLIDIVKLKFDKNGTTNWFIGDQIAHLLTIAITAIILTSTIPVQFIHLKEWFYNQKVIAILTGTFLVLSPVSFLVGMLTKPWRDELDKLLPHADDNLANAGRWIGMSERLLIFVFVLLSQYSAIGFLIAAKSLLRYNDKAVAGEIPPTYISKKSEYILVGTLMSYTAAVCTALAARLFY
ncbi:DUF3307 domain-containing protein [Dyadobacter subterraneus]|uniref:DUF3307 domain-containing protein n=1 Tax=Dyadobacter subterraneus TaxID=2773304 RepID=A0ABR9WGI3_9BACT|nr:DUF3307 domain-containing protein [Dyadobacter subterraneus]MBE9464508.1 DUF3307 domain-containing protein [Dyadobacter subterraneus]